MKLLVLFVQMHYLRAILARLAGLTLNESIHALDLKSAVPVVGYVRDPGNGARLNSLLKEYPDVQRRPASHLRRRFLFRPG
jgi:hypothetical protein